MLRINYQDQGLGLQIRIKNLAFFLFATYPKAPFSDIWFGCIENLTPPPQEVVQLLQEPQLAQEAATRSVNVVMKKKTRFMTEECSKSKLKVIAPGLVYLALAEQ